VDLDGSATWDCGTCLTSLSYIGAMNLLPYDGLPLNGRDTVSGCNDTGFARTEFLCGIPPET
jgi:hypothetical protein